MNTPTAQVLEDEPEIRQFVRSSLEAEGWQVLEAGTLRQRKAEAVGKEALRASRRHQAPAWMDPL